MSRVELRSARQAARTTAKRKVMRESSKTGSSYFSASGKVGYAEDQEKKEERDRSKINGMGIYEVSGARRTNGELENALSLARRVQRSLGCDTQGEIGARETNAGENVPIAVLEVTSCTT